MKGYLRPNKRQRAADGVQRETGDGIPTPSPMPSPAPDRQAYHHAVRAIAGAERRQGHGAAPARTAKPDGSPVQMMAGRFATNAERKGRGGLVSRVWRRAISNPLRNTATRGMQGAVGGAKLAAKPGMALMHASKINEGDAWWKKGLKYGGQALGGLLAVAGGSVGAGLGGGLGAVGGLVEGLYGGFSEDARAWAGGYDWSGDEGARAIHYDDRYQNITPVTQDIDHQVVATDVPEDASTGISVFTGLASTAQQGARLVDAIEASGNATAVSNTLGVAGNLVGGLGSALDLGVKGHQIYTGKESKQDKALTGVDMLSDLSSIAVSSASASNSAGLIGSSAAMAAAGPAAVVMGAANLAHGAGKGLKAFNRYKQLEDMEQQGGAQSGLARFAKDTQETRGMLGAGTMLKGGLGLAGGLALGLGMGPLGWGLLGGAALVGGGMALYKRYRKHRLAAEILNNPNYRSQLERAGVSIPKKADLDGQSWIKRNNPFNTKELRAYELMRGSAANQIAENPDLADILGVPSGFLLGAGGEEAKSLARIMD